GVKIYRSGEPAQLSDFRKGDTLTATIVTSRPPRVVTEKQVEATLAHNAAATKAGGSAAAARSAASGEAARQASAECASGTSGSGATKTARKLPKTASSGPLVGVTGAVLLILGGALTMRRRGFVR